MSDCEQNCIFQNNKECWFACKDKIRADAISEREEYWNMQNHKAYEQGRNDAIEALKEKYLDADAYNEGLADGRADTIKELKNKLYERARDKGIYASEYIAFIDCTFEQLKERE